MERLLLILLLLSGCTTGSGAAISEALDVVGDTIPRISILSREQLVIYYYECKKEEQVYEETTMPNDVDDDELLESRE